MKDLIIGKWYYQKWCKKWLRYEGVAFIPEDPRHWHDFTNIEGEKYNQLLANDFEMMFDFEKKDPVIICTHCKAYRFSDQKACICGRTFYEVTDPRNGAYI